MLKSFSLFLWVIHVESYEQTFNMQRSGICANVLAALIAFCLLFDICLFVNGHLYIIVLSSSFVVRRFIV